MIVAQAKKGPLFSKCNKAVLGVGKVCIRAMLLQVLLVSAVPHGMACLVDVTTRPVASS
jgi:hypothetical protein